MTFVQILQLFNICIGLLLTATLGVFIASGWVHAVRFATWPNLRDTGIKAMEWSVVMLFVLVILVGILQAFERYTSTAYFVLAFIVIVLILTYLIRAGVFSGGKGKGEAEKKKPAKPARGAH